jgi:hypothetical protein
VIAYDAGGVGGGNVDGVRVVAIGVELLRPGESGFQEISIPDACGPAMEGEETVVESEGVALVNPEGLRHRASACNVLR